MYRTTPPLGILRFYESILTPIIIFITSVFVCGGYESAATTSTSCEDFCERLALHFVFRSVARSKAGGIYHFPVRKNPLRYASSGMHLLPKWPEAAVICE
jgi:hypothetical protein